MMTRRRAIRLSASALFTAAQICLILSVVPGAGASTTKARESQTPQAFSVAADSPRWELEGQAKVAEYQGRKSLFLDGGAATLKEFELRDGVVDVDVAPPAARGFFGIQFRIDGGNAEWVYKKGSDELLLAVSELGGGWGFICRLEDVEQ